MSIKSKILITGGTGLLALNFYTALRDKYDVILVLHKRIIKIDGATVCSFDLSSRTQIYKALDIYSPVFVIHTAGLTSVEVCQKYPNLAHSINVRLAENVAAACKKFDVPFVHISTDHLFSGDCELLDEDAQVAPLNIYGETKAEAEVRVADAYPKALIIRTNFYGWGTSYRKSFSDRIIENLRNHMPLTLFDDVYYTPIVIKDLAQAIVTLVFYNAYGIFNVVGDQRLTKYQFGLLVAKIFELDEHLLIRESICNFPKLVNRPLDMSLSNKKISKFLGYDLGMVSKHLQTLKKQELQGLALELRKL